MAGGIAARALKGLVRANRARSYGVLALATLVFTGFLFLSFQKLRQDHEIEIQDIGSTFWLLSQADYELQRLRHALTAYALGDPGYDRATLLERFEIFWSRLPLLIEGAESALIRDSGAAEIVPPMIATLERIEPLLRRLEPGDRSGYRHIAEQLTTIEEPLHHLVVTFETTEIVRGQERRAGRRQIYLEQVGHLTGILASGGLLIVLLFRESRRAQALLARATAARARIEHLAHHDPLTDLPNRLLFTDRLNQGLRRADRSRTLIALHCLDVDHFKAVNDRYGHVVGDRLLIALSLRIQTCLRQSDTLARLGGDEFAIIQCDLRDADGAAQLAQRVLDVMSTPVILDDRPIPATLSIGVGIYPSDAGEPDSLLSIADQALYRAKANGRARFCMVEQPLTEVRARAVQPVT